LASGSAEWIKNPRACSRQSAAQDDYVRVQQAYDVRHAASKVVADLLPHPPRRCIPATCGFAEDFSSQFATLRICERFDQTAGVLPHGFLSGTPDSWSGTNRFKTSNPRELAAPLLANGQPTRSARQSTSAGDNPSFNDQASANACSDGQEHKVSRVHF
jgi:hypothetical protein